MWIDSSTSESSASNSKAPGKGVARSNDTHAISRKRIRRALTRSLYPVVASRLLADHVQERLALLIAHHLESAGQRVGQRRRVLDALGVAAGGAAHQLVVGRRIQIGDGHLARLRGEAFGRVAAHGAL